MIGARGGLALAAWAAALAIAAPAVATAKDLRSVSAMQDHARVLLVFAPSLTDARLTAQRKEFSSHALAMSDRDLALVQVAGDQVIGAHDEADRLRKRYRVAASEYRTLLLGKDGNVAANIVGPISAQHLSERIDAMPMRQEEVRRARAGQGRSN
jgi:hypothetical protein